MTDSHAVVSEEQLTAVIRRVINTRVGNKPQLLGEIMTELRGKANPAEVMKLLDIELLRALT